MGSGTITGRTRVEADEVERQRQLGQLCQKFLARASTHGFTLDEVVQTL